MVIMYMGLVINYRGGGLVQNGGGSKNFCGREKGGGQIILCEQKEEY